MPPANVRRGYRIKDGRLIGERLANGSVYYFSNPVSTSGREYEAKILRLALAGAAQFLSFDAICSAPFIEPEDAFLMRYLSNARKALVKLNERAVEVKRRTCLAQIEKELATLKNRRQ